MTCVLFGSLVQSQLDTRHAKKNDLPGPSSKAQKTAERRQQKQKRKDNEGKLVEKRQEMDRAKVRHHSGSTCFFCIHLCKVADAVKRYSYLLGQTDLFRHFVDVQVRSASLTDPVPILTLDTQRARDSEYAAILDEEPKAKGRGRKKAAYVTIAHLCS